MMKLENLRIQTKLTIVGLIAILSLTALGFVFNYALKTNKVLAFMITSEKNLNNQFRDGTDDYDK